MTESPSPEPVELTPEENDEVLAAELALGLTFGDEAQLLLARMAQDPHFAARVRDWRGHFATIGEGIVPVMPPVRARQRIREELGHASAPLSTPIDSRIRWWQRPAPLIAILVVVLAVIAALVLR